MVLRVIIPLGPWASELLFSKAPGLCIWQITSGGGLGFRVWGLGFRVHSAK